MVTRRQVASVILSILRKYTEAPVSLSTSLDALTHGAKLALFSDIRLSLKARGWVPKALPLSAYSRAETAAELVDVVYKNLAEKSQSSEREARSPRDTSSTSSSKRKAIARKTTARGTGARKPAAARKAPPRRSAGRKPSVKRRFAAKLKAAAPTAEPDTQLMVQVYYGTNRLPSGDETPNSFYGAERADNLSFGIASVSIPPIHKAGIVERPSIWKLEFVENPEKHIVLRSLEPLEKSIFLKKLQMDVQDSQDRTLFVFVHGYHVTFAEAARRAAQMAYDFFCIEVDAGKVKLSCVPMLFSWPSLGQTLPYVVDTNNAQQSADFLKQFLKEVAQKAGAQSITVIAHSMGNLALIVALKEIGLEMRDSDGPLINQIILAAADIDQGLFMQAAEQVKRTGQRVTIYASDCDKALLASHTVNGYPRLGDARNGVLIVDGMDSIDASAAGEDMLAHSYVGGQIVLTDMHALITRGDPPNRRFGLSKKGKPPKQYWLLRPRA